MRLLETITKQARDHGSETAAQDAAQRVARLQQIAMLQDQALQVIAAAEAALDQSLFDCPSLDEAGDGTLRVLRTAH